LRIKLKRNDHHFLTVLTLITLAYHETHVWIDTNAVAVNADSKRHAAGHLTLLQKTQTEVQQGQFDDRCWHQRL
jgi:hypothetical protein